MKRALVLLTVAVSIGLSACGGGGGGQPTTPVTTPTPTTPVVIPTPTASPTLIPTPVPLQNSSYGNAKQSGWVPKDAPTTASTNIFAFGDFRRNGQQMMFIAKQTYSLSLPASQATPSQYGFYVWNDSTSSWVLDSALMPQSNGCVHPRKVLVADFNRDTVPDVFVTCHGHDAAPFAGELSHVVLSQSGGTYVVRTTTTPHFSHGATAFDVNQDGNIDVVLANGNNNLDTVLVNDGAGNFYENANLLPAASIARHNYTVEAIDLNKDGLPDLIFSGDTTSGSLDGAYILMASPGTGFTNSTPIVLPKDNVTEIALDFVFDNGFLYALKTSTLPGASYDKTVVQKINLSDMSWSVVYNQPTGDRWGSFDMKWTTWIIPYKGRLVSQMVSNSLSVPM